MKIALVVAASFFLMEFIAWSNHKYLMHGFLWYLHRDHHENATRGLRKRFEKNDAFFVIYAAPAIYLLIAGFSGNSPFMVATGAGFSLYGIVNFLIHDVMYHKRLPVFKNIRNKYLLAAMRAHDAHHKPKSRDDFHVFGLLIFPGRFFKEPYVPVPRG